MLFLFRFHCRYVTTKQITVNATTTTMHTRAYMGINGNLALRVRAFVGIARVIWR